VPPWRCAVQPYCRGVTGVVVVEHTYYATLTLLVARIYIVVTIAYD
jgi:hypothetical protein